MTAPLYLGACTENPKEPRARIDQSFMVPKDEIIENDYDLSINRYKEIVYEEIAYDPPGVILDELEKLETEIQQGMTELREMLK